MIEARQKVLHCVERMHTNAIETWLARMFRHLRSQGRDVDWYFHTNIAEPGLLEEVYPECKGRIIRNPHALSSWSEFFGALYRHCRAEKYDAVHVHADVMAAPYVVAACLAGVPRVIVHIHNADEEIPVSGSLKKSVIRSLFRRVSMVLAHRVVGISNHTLDTFLAGRRRRPGKDLVHYYGIDPAPFLSREVDALGFRRGLDLPHDAKILLFAGRMVQEKNPLFAIDVLAQMRKMDASVVGVFVGAGALDGAVCRRANELNLNQAFRHLGWRNDLPDIMLCCDWFILPRPEAPLEGFGIAVVEAQLAGLKLLLSLGIPSDPLLPGAAFRRLPLAVGPGAWADAAMDMIQQPVKSRDAIMSALAKSPMDMHFSSNDLLNLYR